MSSNYSLHLSIYTHSVPATGYLVLAHMILTKAVGIVLDGPHVYVK